MSAPPFFWHFGQSFSHEAQVVAQLHAALVQNHIALSTDLAAAQPKAMPSASASASAPELLAVDSVRSADSPIFLPLFTANSLPDVASASAATAVPPAATAVSAPGDKQSDTVQQPANTQQPVPATSAKSGPPPPSSLTVRFSPSPELPVRTTPFRSPLRAECTTSPLFTTSFDSSFSDTSSVADSRPSSVAGSPVNWGTSHADSPQHHVGSPVLMGSPKAQSRSPLKSIMESRRRMSPAALATHLDAQSVRRPPPRPVSSKGPTRKSSSANATATRVQATPVASSTMQGWVGAELRDREVEDAQSPEPVPASSPLPASTDADVIPWAQRGWALMADTATLPVIRD